SKSGRTNSAMNTAAAGSSRAQGPRSARIAGAQDPMLRAIPAEPHALAQGNARNGGLVHGVHGHLALPLETEAQLYIGAEEDAAAEPRPQRALGFAVPEHGHVLRAAPPGHWLVRAGIRKASASRQLDRTATPARRQHVRLADEGRDEGRGGRAI